MPKPEKITPEENTRKFLHEAFCVDGETEFFKNTKPIEFLNSYGVVYEINDKKRGIFYVGIFKPIS